MRKPFAWLGRVHRVLCEVLLLPVHLYRKYISPLKPAPTCRFTPTCSQYAIEAVREWGILAGSVLALWRLLRCNPFSAGGYDPVPRRKRRHRGPPPPDVL